ncbi:MAG: S8 family serine peptidase [bacterium]
MSNLLFILCLVHLYPVQQQEIYGYRAPLINKVALECYESDHVRAWVYFTDKGISNDDYARVLQMVSSNMDKSAYNRRVRKGGTIDHGDIPLDRDYIKEVEALGGLLISESKWLNAASFWLFEQDIDRIAGLDFVYKIDKVASFQGTKETEAALLDSLVFGISYNQLNMFNIDELHNQGFFGSGVIVGILDTGLRRKHTALDNIIVLAEHDFLEGDQIYMNDVLISQGSGVFDRMLFHKTGPLLYLFLSGDTLNNNVNVRDVLCTYSADNGYTWSPLIKLSGNYLYQWVNDLNICGRDTIFLFYRHRYGSQTPFHDMKYMVVSDSTVLVPPTTLVNGISYREPSAVQIDDTIHVIYHTQNHLYLKKGDISGFLSEVQIDSSTLNIHAPEVVAGIDKIGVFYHTMPADSVYLIRSSVPETSFVKTTLWSGKNIEAKTAGDTIFLLWEDRSNSPLSRIAFCISDDFGNTFSMPIYLSDISNAIGKISLEKDGATITALWETQGKIYMRTSYDNGYNFQNLDSLGAEFAYLPTLGTDNTNIIRFHCIRGDSITDGYSPIDPEYSSLRHGTEMLSAIGGYLRETYVGVAPATQFLVAKTENPDESYEFPVEEDTWIAGLEWFESKGADIVNSSLGYTESYYWPNDYDGNTSPASIAATEAVKRGMIIVSSVGNFSIPRISIPGDAEGVITIGGIDSLYNRWQSSGYFPTTDHSLKKPELVCLSHAVVVVHPDSTNSYLASSGTSGAAAMVSGICALLLEGHPNWNADSVRNALFQTASHASTPTDSMGYGWPDALAAFYASPTPFDTLGGSNFLTPHPNPFLLSEHDNIYIPFQLEVSNSVEFRIYSISGRLLRSENRGLLLPGRYTNTNPQSANAAFIWDGRDGDGEDVPSGLYYCLLVTRGGGSDIVKIAVVK